MLSYPKPFSAFPDGESLDPGKLAERAATDANLPPLTVEYDEDAEIVAYTTKTALTAQQQADLDAHVAAYVGETLAEARKRCVAKISAHRRKLMRGPEKGGKVIEYPASSGKLWSLGIEALQEWQALYQRRASLAYAYTVQTCDGMDSHTFVDQAALEAVCDQIQAKVLADNEARDAAVAAVRAADDIPSAEAALVAYIG
jgi:hypothetical protein